MIRWCYISVVLHADTCRMDWGALAILPMRVTASRFGILCKGRVLMDQVLAPEAGCLLLRPRIHSCKVIYGNSKFISH